MLRTWIRGDSDPSKSPTNKRGFTMLVSLGNFRLDHFDAGNAQHCSSEEKKMRNTKQNAALKKERDQTTTSPRRESEVMEDGQDAPSSAVAHQWTQKVIAGDDGHPKRCNGHYHPARSQPPASRTQREGVAGMSNHIANGAPLCVRARLRQAWSRKIERILVGYLTAALKLPT